MRLFGPDFFHLCTRHLRITLQIEMHGPFLSAERRADGSREGAYLGDHLSIGRSPTPAGGWWICNGLTRPASPEPLICLEEHDAVVALGIAHMLGIKGVDPVPRQFRGSPAWASLLREMAADPTSAETWSRGDYHVKDWWNAAPDDFLVTFPEACAPRRHRDVSYQGPLKLTHWIFSAVLFTDSMVARRIRAMPAAVKLRTDSSAFGLRRLAAGTKHASQSRRLLSLAAVLDGMDREQAARIGGMDRQTLRDWVHRFNEHGPDWLKDIRSKGHPPRLSINQLAALAAIVETGPDRAVDGVVRWRRIDLQKVVRERFGVDYHERTIGKLLKQIGFSHISARPHHPAQDERVIEAFKKTSRRH